jgi:pyruvate/2-oxoacid:ferredoxin oxidoreductase beta subunit
MPIADIRDLKRKVLKAAQQNGPSFLHVHAPCGSGWKFPARKTITVAKLAVKSGLWLQWEKANGKIKINKRPNDWEAAGEYLKMQGRFATISDAVVSEIIAEAKRRYQTLLKLEELECL